MVRYDSPTNQYKFKGLEQDTSYTVKIAAESKAEGPNATFTFKTLLGGTYTLGLCRISNTRKTKSKIKLTTTHCNEYFDKL